MIESYIVHKRARANERTTERDKGTGTTVIILTFFSSTLSVCPFYLPIFLSSPLLPSSFVFLPLSIDKQYELRIGWILDTQTPALHSLPFTASSDREKTSTEPTRRPTEHERNRQKTKEPSGSIDRPVGKNLKKVYLTKKEKRRKKVPST